jgi:hypothetical protein
LDKIDDPNLAAHVVWVPRNGAKEQHVDRVTHLVTDGRAPQYWDETGAIIDPYTEMLELTGPCAGVFLLFGPEARWGDDGPPRPDHVEDAHAKQYDRPHPQFDSERLAAKVRETLGS